MEIRIRNIIALFTFMCLRLNMFTTAHESRGNIFAKVVNFLAPGEDYMSENAVRSFFELLEKRVQCSDVSCGKCLSVESVSQLVANFSSSGALGEEDFFRVAAGCCLYLSVSPQACSAIQLGLWAQHTERLILHLTGHGHQEEETGMAMKSMQGLLHDMEKYYRPREGHDPHCLTLNDLLEEGNVSLTHGDRHSLDAVFGIIVYHALRGDCMTAHELPEEGFFLDFIFNRFSSDNFTLHDLESLMRSLNLGDHHDDEHDHLHNEEQHHDDEPRPSREGPGHGHEEGQPQNSSWDSVCFSAAQLVRIHHLNESALSQADFTQLSPALVQQLLSGACSGTIPPVEPTDQLSTTERYLYATLANLLICLTAMFGIVVLLCTSCSGLFQLSIQFCISLAVGSLTGDALLHLLPTFLGLHVHGAGTSSDHKHSEEDFNYLFKLLVVLGGIYFFYLMEAIFSIITHKDSHHTHNHDEDPHHCDHGKVIQMYQRERQTKQSASQVDLVDDPEKEKDLPSKDKHLLPLMITLGDAIHNFADGLAIGAAFSMSWRSGLATSLAVLCHELPHELGDFAILLHCGMSVKRALALNLGSALTSFLGLYIALSVSTDSAAKEWIAAVTAGLFLYVGLADMLPSMIHVKSSRPWLIFLLQNLGLLTGWGILLLLSFYEDRIGF